MVFAPTSISEKFLKIKFVEQNHLKMIFIQKDYCACSLLKLQGQHLTGL